MGQEKTSRRTAGWRDSRGVRIVGGRLRRHWSGLLVGALALALVAAAIIVPGLVVNDARLHDGAIYVAKADGALVGNLNPDSEELAQATSVGAANFRIIQQDKTVVVASTSPNQLAAYDPNSNQMSGPTNLPNNAVPSFGGGVIAVANPDNGRVWFGSVSAILNTDFQQAKAQLEIGEQGLATVTTTGAVIGLNVTTSTLIRPEQAGRPESKLTLPFTLEANASVQLSAVGDKAVVLDRTGQRIWVEGDSEVTQVEAGATAELPPPSETADVGISGARAVYSTRAGLIALTSDGPRSLSGLINQAPVAPLVVGSCAYGAFGNKFVKRCAGQAQAQVVDIPELPAQAELRFASNRGQVVLNDAQSGYIWLVDRDMKLIKDWSRVTPAKENDNQNADDTKNLVNPDRTKKNQKPIAKDDLNLFARQGRSTVLPVLDNDSDPDGDILTIEAAPALKGGPTAALVSGGTGLQLTVPEGWTQTIEFTYTIQDGRGGSATARVKVKPISGDQGVSNVAPLHFRPNETLTLAQNQLASKRALLDWRDPDGDELFLVGAQLVGGTGDEVTFTSDGTVTFQDVGLTVGTKKVRLTVSDGVKTTVSDMIVEVVKSVVPPQANGDQIRMRVGQDASIDPLANDGGSNLTLREVKIEGASKDLTITPNYTDHTVKLQAARAGTYYIEYKVFNGQVSTGLIRVDVLPGGGSSHAPVAARDAVLLPPGGAVLVDPLANDSDDDGDVLVLQSVTSDDHLKIVMEQRRFLTITAESMPTKPITLTYLVSDGLHQTEGTIVVIPTPMTGSQKPKATRDTVKARAGSIVSVPVLANDSSPIGLALTLDKIVEAPAGRAWIDGDRIRVQIPPNATGMSLTYQIKDSEGQTDSATVTITVVSSDAQNEPPSPSVVEARVLAGSTTKILIPLDGVDPNGDPVRLLGLHTGPAKGRVTAVGEQYLSYEAFKTSQGTDSFEYEVVDSNGEVGVAEVRVGIAPVSGNNTAPTGVDDSITVRPGRPVHLPLLQNDYDADGDAFVLVSDDPVDLKPIKTTVVDNNAITFESPKAPGSTVGKYYVRDARGAIGNGTIQVVVDPNAPNLPPVAQDDVVPVSQIVGKDSVEVTVNKNDYDPDGSLGSLKLTVQGQEGKANPATVNPTKSSVIIPIGPTSQQVRYTITDSEGAQASAVVTVPGTQDERPMLRDAKAALVLVAGETATIKLKDYVQGTQGRGVALTNVDNIYATVPRALGATGQITWTPDVNYEGPAALVFEVTDVVPAGDKTAKRAVITIPATIKPAPNVKKKTGKNDAALNQPPILSGEKPVMQVGAGEPEGRFDIAPFFRDPEGQDFSFSKWRATSNAAGVTWRVGDGNSVVYASAEEAVKPNTTITLAATVTDAGGAHDEVSMTIKVLGSTRPRPTTVTDVVDDGVAGQKTTVSVLSNDKSNLLKDTKLTLVSARLLSGSATVTKNGDQVEITPDKGFVGTVTAAYTVQDATGDPSRQTDGTIRVTVRDKPGKPGVPVKESVGDGRVTIRWTDGALNGLPLKSRTVSASSSDGGGGKTQTCASNTCTIAGLTNGKAYRFTVTQSNTLGETTSDQSAPMMPDVKPDAPGQPQVEFKDGALTVTWPAATSKGSRVTGYRITNLNDNKSIELPGTSYTWNGLTNGVTYTFSVAATNRRADDTDGVTGWSDESQASAPEHPTGAPPAPTNVVAADDGSKTQGGWINISWTAPSIPAPENVDPILSYDVYVRKSGSTGAPQQIAQKVDASQRKVSWGQATNAQEYQFTVVAHNRGPKASPASVPSEPVASFGAPDPPNGAKITGGDGTLTLVSIPDTSNGKPADKYIAVIYRNDRAQSAAQEIKVGDTISGLTNGEQYKLLIRASAGNKTSDAAFTNEVTPRGQVGQLTLSTGTAEFKGNAGTRTVKLYLPEADSNGTYNGNHPRDLAIQFSFDGQSWIGVSSGAPISVPISATGNATLYYRTTVKGLSAPGVYQRTVLAPMVVTATKDNVTVKVNAIEGGWDQAVTCSAKGAYLGTSVVDSVSGSAEFAVVRSPTTENPQGYPAAGTAYSVDCAGFTKTDKYVP